MYGTFEYILQPNRMMSSKLILLNRFSLSFSRYTTPTFPGIEKNDLSGSRDTTRFSLETESGPQREEPTGLPPTRRGITSLEIVWTSVGQGFEIRRYLVVRYIHTYIHTQINR